MAQFAGKWTQGGFDCKDPLIRTADGRWGIGKQLNSTYSLQGDQLLSASGPYNYRYQIVGFDGNSYEAVNAEGGRRTRWTRCP
jgi:hypothetical protein